MRRTNLGKMRWVLALVVLGCAWCGAGSVERSAPPLTAIRHIVQPGDTLWALSRLTECGRADKRTLVWMLQKVNHLSSAGLRPGQAILIPTGARSVRSALRRPAQFADQATLVSAASHEADRLL
ncbi:MAG: LysM peptidoglycan-binding domain-containing protein [Armatimonadetes bacterium]|nr:LysM peptidoglycan-binding domain-containing protein [Armatimonadota bacterium]